jgi:hypothetical protein
VSADGEYIVQGLPTGTCRVDATASGFLSAQFATVAVIDTRDDSEEGSATLTPCTQRIFLLAVYVGCANSDILAMHPGSRQPSSWADYRPTDPVNQIASRRSIATT